MPLQQNLDLRLAQVVVPNLDLGPLNICHLRFFRCWLLDRRRLGVRALHNLFTLIFSLRVSHQFLLQGGFLVFQLFDVLFSKVDVHLFEERFAFLANLGVLML